MRTSKDEWRYPDGSIVALSQDQTPPDGATVWNGYDYRRQMWIHNGKHDTRTLAELQDERVKEFDREQAKSLAISDIGLTEDEAERAVDEFTDSL